MIHAVSVVHLIIGAHVWLAGWLSHHPFGSRTQNRLFHCSNYDARGQKPVPLKVSPVADRSKARWIFLTLARPLPKLMIHDRRAVWGMVTAAMAVSVACVEISAIGLAALAIGSVGAAFIIGAAMAPPRWKMISAARFS